MLSEIGIRQTVEASYFVDEGIFDFVFSSDLTRAVRTAEILFPHLSKKIVIDKRLRECNYGDLNGCPCDLVDYSAHIYDPFPNGESLNDVRNRVVEFLNELNDKHYSAIAIVSHHATQIAFDVCIRKVSWQVALENDWRVSGIWQCGWDYYFQS